MPSQFFPKNYASYETIHPIENSPVKQTDPRKNSLISVGFIDINTEQYWGLFLGRWDKGPARKLVTKLPKKRLPKKRLPKKEAREKYV